MKLNNKGYSLVEMLIAATVMLVFLGGGSLYYSSYAEKIQETEILIESKLQYTKSLAMRNAEGKDNPYLIFEENEYIYLDKDGNELFERKGKYTDVKNSQVKVRTNVPKNKIFFSPKGFAYGENGKILGNVHIWVSKGDKTTTISIDCKGNFSKKEGKDDSPLEVCPVLVGEEAYVFPNITIKNCKSGEELLNGKCLTKCGENEHRDESNNCVCNVGYEEKNGKCVIKEEKPCQLPVVEEAEKLICPSNFSNKKKLFEEWAIVSRKSLFPDVEGKEIKKDFEISTNGEFNIFVCLGGTGIDGITNSVTSHDNETWLSLWDSNNTQGDSMNFKASPYYGVWYNEKRETNTDLGFVLHKKKNISKGNYGMFGSSNFLGFHYPDGSRIKYVNRAAYTIGYIYTIGILCY